MRTILKNHTIRKGLLLYRKIRYRRGFGVHSPFVFKFITQVIEEKRAYYSYDDITLFRKKLAYCKDEIIYEEEGIKQTVSLDTVVSRYDLKKKEGELLFRLTNFFKPVHILQIAPSEPFSELYLTAFSEKVKCYVLQNYSLLSILSEKINSMMWNREMDIRKGEYLTSLQQLMKDISPDFIYLNALSADIEPDAIWKAILSQKHTKTVCVIRGIHQGIQNKALWKTICRDPETTVTLDLYSYGIVLFDKKYHKRTYKVNF